MVATRAATRAQSGPAPARLADGISAKARLHVVTGKGGTGKTTAAAALSLALAEGGRKVLLVEVESRQAMAQLFNTPAMPYTEQRLTSVGKGQVFGLAIDPEQAMLEYLEMFYGLKRAGKGLKKLGAVDFVTTLAPGLRDVLLTGKVKESVVRVTAQGTPTYDAVVLDAPPTGRIARFLDATQEVAKLTKFGPISNQSEGVIKLLHGPRTAVHIVTLLEEMPVQETVDAVTELRSLGFTLGSVIVNRARPTLISDGQVGADGSVDLEQLTAGLEKANISAVHAPALATEMAAYAERQQVQEENATRLDALDLPRIELPDLNPPVELGELMDLAARFRSGGDR
jgi:anion-transporting  ArsA/GET3 family ATPase